MLTNEIRRLVRCIVEASAESNIQFEEIQAEIAKQFGKEIQPQVYQDVEPQDFKKKAKLFLKNEIGQDRICGKFENAIELLCVFHELRCEIPKEDIVPMERLTKMFVERCCIKESTARQYFSQTGYQIKRYLGEQKGIGLKNNVSINTILENVHPFIEQM